MNENLVDQQEADSNKIKTLEKQIRELQVKVRNLNCKQIPLYCPYYQDATHLNTMNILKTSTNFSVKKMSLRKVQ